MTESPISYEEQHPVRQGIAGGTTFAAAALLLVAGLLSLFQGISAAVNDELIVAGPEYAYKFDLTAWGWIHIIVGVLAVLIAIGLFTGALWAQVAAITVASLSIVVNFLWLPWYPWWSIIVIAVDVIVIWAVATWRN